MSKWALAYLIVPIWMLSGSFCSSETPQPSSETKPASSDFDSGRFAWTLAAPVAQARPCGGEKWHSLKDPSVVRHNDRLHVFCTVRGVRRSHGIVTLSFSDWAEAGQTTPTLLQNHAGFFCAPQVFYFTPQRRWYLICQASDKSWTPEYQAAYATTDRIEDPASWSLLKPLGAHPAPGGNAGLDFWIVCDERKAHLFFTTNDGHVWREETTLDAFPGGWSEAALAIQGDVFEASHTYRLKGRSQWLTLVEAQSDRGADQGGPGWRYQKAYLADRLEGPWKELAAGSEKTFASMLNVRLTTSDRWTDSISHAELLRAGVDERLEVDPASLRVLFQGVTDRDRAGKAYGQIPWRLGLLEPVR